MRASVLVRVSFAVKRHHDQGNSYKENIYLIGVAYSFRGSVHYYGGQHGGKQVDMVLEK